MRQIMNQLIEKPGNKKKQQQMQNAEVQNTQNRMHVCINEKGCQHIVKDDLSHCCGRRRERTRTK